MLILSILALVAGPLLYHHLRRGGRIARVVDRVLVVLLVGVVAFVLVPDVLETLGPIALALVLAGYLVPGVLEALIRGAARTFHTISLLLALLGLVLHAVLDGAGLAASEAQSAPTLALAIVLHRFGMGLILWLMVWPEFGRRAASGVLVLVAIATVGGYWLSGHLLALEPGRTVQAIQAVIVGAIVHSLIHRGHVHDPSSDTH